MCFKEMRQLVFRLRKIVSKSPCNVIEFLIKSYRENNNSNRGCGGARARTKGADSRSAGVGRRGFKSHPPHQFTKYIKIID